MDNIKLTIAMWLIGIAFKIMPTEDLEDIYATWLHWKLQTEDYKKVFFKFDKTLL